MKANDLHLQFSPVTKKRWSDFEMLFGERGACGGCWCMLWRLTRKEFENQKGAGNRKAMKAIIEAGKIPGILAFSQGEPVAWCSVAPRDHFPALDRSRILKPVDEMPVWSISCLFVDKPFRRKGLSTQMIVAAVDYAKKKGRVWPRPIQRWDLQSAPAAPKPAPSCDSISKIKSFFLN